MNNSLMRALLRLNVPMRMVHGVALGFSHPSVRKNQDFHPERTVAAVRGADDPLVRDGGLAGSGGNRAAAGVTDGHEQSELLSVPAGIPARTVTVKVGAATRARYGAIPARTVAVKVGAATVCVIYSRGGKGSCARSGATEP
jgi:hypothetical protein